jgi:hypothetical protein
MDLFNPTHFVIKNQCWIIYILKSFIPGDRILMLYLANVFKNKIDCCSVMDTAGLRVPTKQIRGFSTSNVSNVSRLSPSAGCVVAANSIWKSLDVYKKNNISTEDKFSLS